MWLKNLGIWLALLVMVWAFHFTIANQMDPYFFTILMYAGINIILATSLNLVNGFTGQFSIGHAGFMSVGGYTAAFISTTVQASHPEWFAGPQHEVYFDIIPNMATFVFIGSLAAGAAVSAMVGYIVGLPSLRLKGDYLAIVTLGFGEIIRVVVLNVDAVGGARGMPNIPRLSSFGAVYSIVVLTVFVIWRLVNSAHGRAMLSVREDEIAAEAMGVNTTQAKVRAFVIGAAFAGVAGGLFAHYLQYLNPATFDFNRSFEIIIMVVLGGMGSISGSVIAALFLTGMREALRELQKYTHVDYRMVIYSLMLIVLMLTRPYGIFGTSEITDFMPKWLRKKIIGGGGVAA